MTVESFSGINYKSLIEACEVFGTLADSFGQLSQQTTNGAAAALQCRAASAYALQLAYFIQNGMAPYDAILRVAQEDAVPVP